MKGEQDLAYKLRLLIIVRLCLASFILGTILFFYLRGAWLYPISYLFIWTGIIYFLSLIYIILLRFIKRLKALSYIQIVLDLILITALIYITGEKDSIFTFLYELSIMSACIILQKRGGFGAASLSCIFYGGLLDLGYYGIIPTLSPHEYELGILYHILINFFAFYLIALLTTTLTEQIKRSKERLHELEALHRHIVSSLNAGLITTNKEGEITSFNRAAELITGLKSEEILGKRLKDVFSELKDERMNGEMGFLRPDSRFVFLGYSISSLVDEKGKGLGRLIVFRDLTEVKRLRALSIMGRFAANIAHEIRNPLAAISGCVQVLNQELKLEGENKRLFDIVLSEVNRLNILISEFLSFSRPTPDKKERVNIRKIIDETLKLLTKSKEWRENIKIKKALLDNVYIKASPERLRQVFLNLFLNAIEAMPDGGRLSISMDFPTRGFVNITIKDTGTGIEERYINRVFEPFFSTKENGTGLGLSIVQRAIEELEGRIELKTKIGEGTEFKITLPVAEFL